jgi:hypothetical protein
MLAEWNQTSPGAGWAAEDIELAKKYPGKWVVALPGEVIALGDDPDEVLDRAAEKVGLPREALVLTIIAPLESRITFWK